ncbi:ABC-2 type transport system permease protein [Paramicrobacterium humi]|uniref:ABC-2 type transport system permease protein n=1 Tax=Paramicrobacterium humi TaxID=640635 RepID=A0A1H4JY82_9MICO|nr:ABC transporter permease [Microbacterium humi]SEB50976.1 ABC-2 type transport system permease protein [Microbacterium humi]
MTALTAPLIPTLPAGRSLRLGLRRIPLELKMYFRAGDQVFFTFLFPTLIYALFATVFSDQELPDGVSMATYYLPGLIAGAILLSGVQNLAGDIAVEKSDGTLKRLGGSPLSPVSYFIGKLGQVVVTSLLQLALLVGVAVLGFDAALPDTAEGWAIVAWVYVLGIAACSFAGIALSALPRSGKTASAVIIPIVLVLQFISGVYLQFSALPEWLQSVAGFFPVRWMAQGLRGAFLPESYAAAEQSGAWDLPLVAIMLAVWIVVGLVLARLTFRWIHKDK